MRIIECYFYFSAVGARSPWNSFDAEFIYVFFLIFQFGTRSGSIFKLETRKSARNEFGSFTFKLACNINVMAFASVLLTSG